jgi:hypothetical protein
MDASTLNASENAFSNPAQFTAFAGMSSEETVFALHELNFDFLHNL